MAGFLALPEKPREEMRSCNVLQVAVLMCACAVTLAIVCEKDSCAKVECDVGVSKESCVDGEFNERGSFCGCCATCDKHLEEGESCLLLEIEIQGGLSCFKGRRKLPASRAGDTRCIDCLVSDEGESCLLLEIEIQEEGESCLLLELGIQGFPLVPCKSPLSCLNGVCSLPQSTSAHNETHA
uniref:Uncharacterized protein n=1 Tax=Timema douglasi TaxID=61478 RepID=A0A7R8Z8M1_TIMDO|nr:unnamed protein product [Timema douglasi]